MKNQNNKTACVYRYIDLADNIIKYVGIVHHGNLNSRLRAHAKTDQWCMVRKWRIEILSCDKLNRTDAEYLEAHFISLYHTDKWFNKAKAGWGVSSIISYSEDDWQEYKSDLIDTEINKEKELEIKRLEEKLIMVS